MLVRDRRESLHLGSGACRLGVTEVGRERLSSAFQLLEQPFDGIPSSMGDVPKPGIQLDGGHAAT